MSLVADHIDPSFPPGKSTVRAFPVKHVQGGRVHLLAAEADIMEAPVVDDLRALLCEETSGRTIVVWNTHEISASKEATRGKQPDRSRQKATPRNC